MFCAVVSCALLAGCQAAPPDGTYVTFMREAMVESARLLENAGEGPERSEHAERAVSAWRGSGTEGSGATDGVSRATQPVTGAN